MTDLTKLAEQLDAFNELSASLAISEAARILRSAAGVDVAGLMAMSDTSIVLACDYLMAHKESAKEKAIEHRAELESALRLALAAREVPEPWVNVRGCGWHHYTPQNIDAMIRDLKAVEQGNEIPEWVNRDHRTRCGILWRVISALSHDVPLNPDPVTTDDGLPPSPQGWQPIETAPKDGTDILLAIIDAEHAYIDHVERGYFEVVAEDEEDGPWDMRDGEPWCSYEGRSEGLYWCYACGPDDFNRRGIRFLDYSDSAKYTHWMPLPAAAPKGTT